MNTVVIESVKKKGLDNNLRRGFEKRLVDGRVEGFLFDRTNQVVVVHVVRIDEKECNKLFRIPVRENNTIQDSLAIRGG